MILWFCWLDLFAMKINGPDLVDWLRFYPMVPVDFDLWSNKDGFWSIWLDLIYFFLTNGVLTRVEMIICGSVFNTLSLSQTQMTRKDMTRLLYLSLRLSHSRANGDPPCCHISGLWDLISVPLSPQTYRGTTYWNRHCSITR